MDNK
jgi:hypothetical protein